MCQDADPLASCLSKAVGVVVGTVLQRPGANKKRDCFSCSDSQHFARDCPSRQGALSPHPSSSRSAMPSSLCPRCKKGYHWANLCRSKANIVAACSKLRREIRKGVNHWPLFINRFSWPQGSPVPCPRLRQTSPICPLPANRPRALGTLFPLQLSTNYISPNCGSS